MLANWRYIVAAILLLGSGCLFLLTIPYLGQTTAYLVSLPIFAVGVFIGWRGRGNPPES